MLLSLYMAVTAVVFALYLRGDTERRLELCLKAYAASTVVASIFAVIGYLGVGGLGEFLSRYGRASGTFKDPNVLGSYLVLGGVYFVQNLVLLRTRHIALDRCCLCVVVTGIFLSFSRGSWGAFVIAAFLCVALAYATTGESQDPPAHRDDGASRRWRWRSWPSRCCWRSTASAICSCSARPGAGLRRRRNRALRQPAALAADAARQHQRARAAALPAVLRARAARHLYQRLRVLRLARRLRLLPDRRRHDLRGVPGQPAAVALSVS